MLTKSQLFTPSFGFPFHVEGEKRTRRTRCRRPTAIRPVTEPVVARLRGSFSAGRGRVGWSDFQGFGRHCDSFALLQ